MRNVSIAVSVVAAAAAPPPKCGSVRSNPATTIVAPGPKKKRSAKGPRMNRLKLADGAEAGPDGGRPGASRESDSARRGAVTGERMEMILSPQEAGET